MDLTPILQKFQEWVQKHLLGDIVKRQIENILIIGNLVNQLFSKVLIEVVEIQKAGQNSHGIYQDTQKFYVTIDEVLDWYQIYERTRIWPAPIQIQNPREA